MPSPFPGSSSSDSDVPARLLRDRIRNQSLDEPRAAERLTASRGQWQALRTCWCRWAPTCAGCPPVRGCPISCSPPTPDLSGETRCSWRGSAMRPDREKPPWTRPGSRRRAFRPTSCRTLMELRRGRRRAVLRRHAVRRATSSAATPRADAVACGTDRLPRHPAAARG